MTADISTMRIDIREDGPYVVHGNIPLLRIALTMDANGDPDGWKVTHQYETGEIYTLCRCGASENKPFCDGSHIPAGFSSDIHAEKLPRFTDNADKTSGGDGLSLIDANDFCIGIAHCHRAGGTWSLTKQSTTIPEAGELATEQAQLCPSGRLVMVRGSKVLEAEYEPSIALIEDPRGHASSAIWVRGGIPIFDSHGRQLEIRNKVTLCRCGASRNKPFCDGMHYHIKFDDGHADG